MRRRKRSRTIRRLPATWRVPAAPEPVEWERPRMERVQRPEVAFDWVNDRSRYAGAALHGFLQRIAREGLAAWDEACVRSRRAAYRAVLTNLGVPSGDLAWADRARGIRSLANFARSARALGSRESCGRRQRASDRRIDGRQFVRGSDRSDVYRRERRPLDNRLQNQRRMKAPAWKISSSRRRSGIGNNWSAMRD